MIRPVCYLRVAVEALLGMPKTSVLTKVLVSASLRGPGWHNYGSSWLFYGRRVALGPV